MNEPIYSIGHSNLPLDQFFSLLPQHHIEALVDIRRFPSSRKFPYFNQTDLSASLQKTGIEYHWLEGLGGRRHNKGDAASLNEGLANEGFRNYADYMLTEQFRESVEQLLEIARSKRTAIMCAESVYWRCHRRLVSDFLFAHGVAVQHIFPSGESRVHELTPGAKIEAGKLTYPAGQKSLFA